MKNKIFDLINIKDLPDSIRRYLPTKRKGFGDTIEEKMFDVLKMSKEPLDTSEVLVGYYRLHKEEVKKGSIAAYLSQHSQGTNSKIKRVSHGLYELRK